MPQEFTRVDVQRMRQFRPLKIDYRRVRNLKYFDKFDLRPQSFVEYSRIYKVIRGLNAEEMPRPAFGEDLRHLETYNARLFRKGKVLVLVNNDLYPSVQASIDQYIRDLAYEGYFATAYRVISGTAAEMRAFIQSKYPAGVLMVGSLPVAWFEMSDDFWDSTSEFPCDLYFMDLNGTWNDPDNDGKFSEHPTGVEPEIWLGRLWTPTQNGNDAGLINDYFSRNHRYRKGQLGYSDRALAYVDDDWTGFDDCAFDLMLPGGNIETITDPNTTDGDRYKAEVNQHRAWAQICAHSSPGGHSFSAMGSGEWVPASYLRDVNPPDAYFYNLFACSNALFTQSDYMAGWYIFDKSGASRCNGMAAVGSTKTGAMLLFENFYGPMGAGRTIGEAFVQWWRGLGGSHELDERRWYYGMTLIGDPTLNWWSGVVPELWCPYDGDTFDHFPRRTTLTWERIGLNNVRYNVEIDAHSAIVSGQWAAESGNTWFVSGNLLDNNFEHLFVGMQRGRWRVRARVGSQVCPWSDWRYFRYTV